ncbi:MAG: tRNA1(Val) (adenine(37)-N6)-methyltransferase [Shimia sp.]
MTTTSISGAEAGPAALPGVPQAALDAEATRDAFLGARVMAWQPRRGYRAGVDAVFLAAACPARAGEAVLELGCGTGVPSLCLAARTGASVTGVERQRPYAALARANGLAVVEADLTALPQALRARTFDHVLMNPPYHEPTARLPGADAGREAAHAGDTPLEAWSEAAARRLRQGGTLTAIMDAARTDGLVAAVAARFGSLDLLPLAPRAGRDARLILLRARKEGRAAFRLRAPLAIHAGDRHVDDRPAYAQWAHEVLHEGAAIPWPH